MATNEVIDGEDITIMDSDDLCDHLLEQSFPDEAISTIKGTLVVMMILLAMHYLITSRVYSTKIYREGNRW